MSETGQPYFLHATYYVTVAADANALCNRRDGVSEGLALLTQEWPNIETAWTWCSKLADNDTDAARLCLQYLRCSSNRLLVQARPLQLAALAQYMIDAAGILKDKISEADALALSGHIYTVAGRFADAAKPLKQALAIREAVVGRDHPDTATVLNDLGELYYALGRYTEAEPLLRRALTVRQKSLKQNHPTVAVSLNNLGLLYVAQTQFGRAEPLFQHALAIQEEVLGRDHPDVAQTLTNLSEIYLWQGHYSRAQKLAERALSILEKSLHSDHPNVGRSLLILTEVCLWRGNHTRAQKLAGRAQSVLELAFGPDHSDVARSLTSMARAQNALNSSSGSILLCQRALNIQLKTVGTHHPDVAHTLAALAIAKKNGARTNPTPHSLDNVNQVTGNTLIDADAYIVMQQASEIRITLLGTNHPYVGVDKANLGSCCSARGDLERAVHHFRDAINIFASINQDHPILVSLYFNLFLTQMRQLALRKNFRDLPVALKYLGYTLLLRSGTMAIARAVSNTVSSIFNIIFALLTYAISSIWSVCYYMFETLPASIPALLLISAGYEWATAGIGFLRLFGFFICTAVPCAFLYFRVMGDSSYPFPGQLASSVLNSLIGLTLWGVLTTHKWHTPVLKVTQTLLSPVDSAWFLFVLVWLRLFWDASHLARQRHGAYSLFNIATKRRGTHSVINIASGGLIAVLLVALLVGAAHELTFVAVEFGLSKIYGVLGWAPLVMMLSGVALAWRYLRESTAREDLLEIAVILCWVFPFVVVAVALGLRLGYVFHSPLLMGVHAFVRPANTLVCLCAVVWNRIVARALTINDKEISRRKEVWRGLTEEGPKKYQDGGSVIRTYLASAACVCTGAYVISILYELTVAPLPSPAASALDLAAWMIGVLMLIVFSEAWRDVCGAAAWATWLGVQVAVGRVFKIWLVIAAFGLIVRYEFRSPLLKLTQDQLSVGKALILLAWLVISSAWMKIGLLRKRSAQLVSLVRRAKSRNLSTG